MSSLIICSRLNNEMKICCKVECATKCVNKRWYAFIRGGAIDCHGGRTFSFWGPLYFWEHQNILVQIYFEVLQKNAAPKMGWTFDRTHVPSSYFIQWDTGHTQHTHRINSTGVNPIDLKQADIVLR